MRKLKSHVKYDGEMDSECIDLCNTLNAVGSIETFESCCGHGKNPFRIWFQSYDDDSLFFVARCADKRYFRDDWNITVSVGDNYSDGIVPTHFCLESKNSGMQAYIESKDLVDNMNHHLNHDVFLKGFDLKLGSFIYEEVEEI